MWRAVRGLILGAQRTEALLCVVCALLTTAFVTAALLVLLRREDVSVGDMAIVASSVAALATLNQLVVWASGCVEVAQFIGDLDAPLVQRAAAGPSRTGGAPTRLEGIVFEGASFTYRGRTVPAIDEATVHLAASGLVVLTGPNGAGKSTLAKLASGALHPDQGAVRWLRVDGTSTPPSWQEVSVLHQDEAMLPLSVRDFVRMGTDASDQQIAAALRRTGLGPLLEAAPRLLEWGRGTRAEPSSRAASSSACAWPGCCSRIGRCGCSTSRPARSMPPGTPTSWHCCARRGRSASSS